jgi:hypothetical protein
MLKASAEPKVVLAVAELAASELMAAWVTPTLPAMASYSAVRASTCRCGSSGKKRGYVKALQSNVQGMQWLQQRRLICMALQQLMLKHS